MSWSVLASYIAGYFYVCTSSFFNATQCLKVWEYMPAYINDLTEFKSSTPYQSEKDYLEINPQTGLQKDR